MKLLSSSILLFLLSCNDYRNRAINNDAKNESVDIPGTSVKNQGNTGFCTTYTTVAFLESIYKQRTGTEISLSEAFIGYHVIVQNMLKTIEQIRTAPGADKQKKYDELVQDLKNKQNFSYFEGAWPISFQGAQPTDVFEVIKKYGVVPDKAFEREFNDPGKAEEAMLEIHRKFLERFNSPDASVTESDLINHVLPGGLGFLHAPPKLIAVPGSVQTTTPVEFYKSLKINLDDFAVMPNKVNGGGGLEESSADYDNIIQAVKETLEQKIPVPISASVDWVRWLNQDAKTGNWLAEFSAPYWTNLSTAYGHEMLVVDFVNVGGKQGALTTLEELKNEVSKSPRALDYLVVKNSWGTDYAPPSSQDKPGYFRLKKNFLLANTFSHSAYLTVVVPKAIAQKYQSTVQP